LALATATVVNTTEPYNSLTIAVAAVTQAVTVQLCQCRFVGVIALTLIEQVAIPMQTMGFELFKNSCGGAGDFSGRITIFDSNQPLALMMARIDKAGQSTD
jgi:hypothetical protein